MTASEILVAAAVFMLDACLFFSQALFPSAPSWLKILSWTALIVSAVLAAYFFVLRGPQR